MRITASLIAFGSCIFVSAAALAATVTSDRGEVLVNRGDGYKLVTAPTQVVAGDQIIANPKGRGQVVFPDGCALKIEPGVVMTVSAQSPCTTRGSHVETGGSLKDDPVPEERDDRRYLLKGLIIGGAAIGAILLLKDKSASP